MPDLALAVLFIAAAYLLGSIPFPLLIGNLKGIDVRSVGSSNIGAGNLSRTAGWPAGSAAAVLDVFKGILPFMVGPGTGFSPGVVGTAGLAAVAGHNWSIYLGGLGGRGLATSTGVVLGLNPALVIWPAAWSMFGWRVGGGVGGFIGWGLLPVYAAIASFSATEERIAFGLAVLMIVRRAEGGEERTPGISAAVRRVVFDTGWPGGGTERLGRA